MKLTLLRNAIIKLEEAEQALHEARMAYHRTETEYKTLDRLFEDAGDASKIVEHILAREEDVALHSQERMR